VLDTVLRARHVVTPDGERPAAVGLCDGRIAVVAPYDEPLVATSEQVLRDDLVLLPGLVDTHVHLQDPGRDWEGFDSGTRAAALGGVTTVVDMPLDSLPVTLDADGVRAKVAAARGRVHVDVALWGGVTPDNLDRVDELAATGVRGFKCFLADTGTTEFAPLEPHQLPEVLRRVATTGLVLLVHAEDAETLAAHGATGPVRSYDSFLRHHPRSAETQAVAAVIAAVAETGARAHVVHVSTGAAVALIGLARAEGLPLSAETCPHYRVLDAPSTAVGGTLAKVCPPVQNGESDGLWEGLRTGALDLVVSDHSPCALTDKRLGSGDLTAAVGGIASLQLGLPLVWTAARERGFTLVDVALWMAQRPAELAGLDTKGAIEVGRDADLVVLDPGATFVVEPGRLAHRLTRTPYDGRSLTGVVSQTWLAGSPVDLSHPRGRVLLHGHHDRMEPRP